MGGVVKEGGFEDELRVFVEMRSIDRWIDRDGFGTEQRRRCYSVVDPAAHREREVKSAG